MSWILLRSRQLLNTIIRNKVPHRFYFPSNKTCLNTNILVLLTNNSRCLTKVNLEILRSKHNKNKKDLSETEDEEEADDWEDKIVDKQTKVMTLKINSLRADLILKAGLGIARNKIETMFYESKIRINGRKLLKKSVTLNIGDEIDIVKGSSPANPEFLIVARVEILSATERNEGVSVKVRRNKALTIENYSGEHSWK